MRRKGRVVRVITEATAGSHGKAGGKTIQLATYKKVPGRGSTNPRNRKSMKSKR